MPLTRNLECPVCFAIVEVPEQLVLETIQVVTQDVVCRRCSARLKVRVVVRLALAFPQDLEDRGWGSNHGEVPDRE